MKKLENRLTQFSLEQLRKFIEREQIHARDSVTKDEIDWSTFDKQKLYKHFLQEISEFVGEPAHYTYKRSLDYDSYRNRKELIDIANLAFLLWSVGEFKD